jgi:hypothetical protein
MGVILKKYEDTFEVESKPYQTIKQALAEMKILKSRISKDEEIKTKFRIVKI